MIEIVRSSFGTSNGMHYQYTTIVIVLLSIFRLTFWTRHSHTVRVETSKKKGEKNLGFEIQEPETEVVPEKNENQKQDISNGKNHDEEGESFLLQ